MALLPYMVVWPHLAADAPADDRDNGAQSGTGAADWAAAGCCTGPWAAQLLYFAALPARRERPLCAARPHAPASDRCGKHAAAELSQPLPGVQSCLMALLHMPSHFLRCVHQHYLLDCPIVSGYSFLR